MAIFDEDMHHLAIHRLQDGSSLSWRAVLAYTGCFGGSIGCNDVAMLLDSYGFACKAWVSLLLHLQWKESSPRACPLSHLKQCQHATGIVRYIRWQH